MASDIDSASVLRFRAIHRLFCSHDLIEEDSCEWRVLGLKATWPWYDPDRGGIPGLGLDGFYERFPARGQVERVEKIRRRLGREIGLSE